MGQVWQAVAVRALLNTKCRRGHHRKITPRFDASVPAAAAAIVRYVLQSAPNDAASEIIFVNHQPRVAV